MLSEKLVGGRAMLWTSREAHEVSGLKIIFRVFFLEFSGITHNDDPYRFKILIKIMRF